MSSPREMIAFWLQPARSERDFFASLIRQLAARLGAPIFEPHVTLHGSVLSVARAREILGSVSAPPVIQLDVERVAFSEAYTKTVFIQFRPSAEAKALSAACAQAAGASDTYKFDPHLSLIYKAMSLSAKQELARAIELPFAHITFDSIKAISCPERIEKREDVEAWRILGERQLAQ